MMDQRSRRCHVPVCKASNSSASAASVPSGRQVGRKSLNLLHRLPDGGSIAADQDAKLKFENTATGYRAAVAATAMTGHRGDRVLYDDPHSVESALSEVQRQTVLRVFSETVKT